MCVCFCVPLIQAHSQIKYLALQIVMKYVLNTISMFRERNDQSFYTAPQATSIINRTSKKEKEMREGMSLSKYMRETRKGNRQEN